MTPEQYAKSGSEFAHQTALFMWIAMVKQQWPELSLAFAIKNEEKSGSKVVGGRFKASGVKADIPDIFLPVARKGCHGLFIEMKRPGKKARAGQAEMGIRLQAEGYGWACCDGWDKAKDVLIQYLS